MVDVCEEGKLSGDGGAAKIRRCGCDGACYCCRLHAWPLRAFIRKTRNLARVVKRSRASRAYTYAYICGAACNSTGAGKGRPSDRLRGGGSGGSGGRGPDDKGRTPRKEKCSDTESASGMYARKKRGLGLDHAGCLAGLMLPLLALCHGLLCLVSCRACR